MTRDDYKDILNQALQEEHGIRLPFNDWAVAEFVRAQLYRFRSRLRYTHALMAACCVLSFETDAGAQTVSELI